MEVRTPDLEELSALREKVGDGPIVLVNLIKFRGQEGMARFGDYARLTAPLMAAAGTEVVYSGQAGPSLSGVDWDMVGIVKFPSVEAFTDMIGSPLYQTEAGPIREEAIERTIWLVTHPHIG